MKSAYVKWISALLCVALLCGCAANNGSLNADENTPTANAPQNEQQDPAVERDDLSAEQEDTQNEGETAPDESESEDAPAVTEGTQLSSAELGEWNDYFNKMENNGLLRFAYSDPANDPAQLAPYLWLLFYDLGDNEGKISEEEFALLAAQDAWLELDTLRLTRGFITAYLAEKFGAEADELLRESDLGYYLPEYDAWYLIHGDTWYDRYSFERGMRFDEGIVELYYSAYIACYDENGELDLVREPMVVTLREVDGQWRIVSNVSVNITAPGDLSSAELAKWESEFNEGDDYETNGLLRFPYTDVHSDPEQIVPYLWLLFYDTHIGEEIDDEEWELLNQRYELPDVGLSRLFRGYAVIFLRDYFGLDQEVAERLMTDPDPAPSQYYLGERDSWYMAHGDTAYHHYDFDRGVRLDDKTIKLYYSVDFLEIVTEDGARSYLRDVDMVATICVEDPNWYVISNEIVGE